MAVSDHDILAHLAGAQSIGDVIPYVVLTRLSEEPASFETLADEFDVDRTTIYRLLDPVREWHFISNDGTDYDGYEVTGFGAVVLHHIDAATTADEFGDSDSGLSYLLRSILRPTLLRRLRTNPARKADLARGSANPSRSTVHRTIAGFLDHGLVTRDRSTGQYTLTTAGRDVLATYDSLMSGVRIARRHTIFFCCCDDRIADFPLESLTTAEQIIDEPVAPDRTMVALQKVVAAGVDDIRSLRSCSSAQRAAIFYPVIKSGVPYELLITGPVLYTRPKKDRYRDIVHRAIRATNVRLLVVPEVDEFPVELDIINGDTVVVAPSNPRDSVDFGDGLQSEMIIGSDADLIAWAEAHYQRYREVSVPPLRYLISNLLNHSKIPDTKGGGKERSKG
ncbi:transcriptional regulator FilR1 domain-containing protein [Haloprofundus halophilus]|uniref:transcriptional regulator FilR1 domain-containing protein n=1 Tax=Haloprofundus halophilus TaxID=2283527 RepID=UPI0013004F70|nr:hypothetical protein [Haloprofundus halophilus]